MDKTDTPRTDAYEREFNAGSLTNGDVEILNFARTLERDLAAATKRVEVLEGALRGFEDMDTVDQGTSYANSMRDKFIKACPEYVGFCELARAALSPKTEGK